MHLPGNHARDAPMGLCLLLKVIARQGPMVQTIHFSGGNNHIGPATGGLCQALRPYAQRGAVSHTSVASNPGGGLLARTTAG